MRKRASIINVDSLSYVQFESQVIEAIINAYLNRNGNEYFLIIDLMRIENPEFVNIIKNALIIILSLFFLEKTFECGEQITSCTSHEKQMFESLCLID